MTTVLEIDTTKSLYKPIEIKIDGETFRVRTVTQGILEEVQRFSEDAKLGSAVAIRHMLELVLDGPNELLLKLTIPQIVEVVETAIGKAVAPKGKEKNGRRPGLKK
ncbi:MAG: hypothetical protein MUQ00_06580 [Candidatus Aminicenantes bacterium]|nr:hypothetical protein [Candidatus Aminicenantes bacterium]